MRNGFRIDKVNVSKDEQAFLIELHKFMKSRNTPIGRIPSLGFKQSRYLRLTIYLTCQFLGSSNSAADIDMMSKYGKMGKQLPDGVENIVGKGEMARYEHFFSNNIFKSCLLLMRQNEYLWRKGLTLSQMTELRLFQTERGCRQQI